MLTTKLYSLEIEEDEHGKEQSHDRDGISDVVEEGSHTRDAFVEHRLWYGTFDIKAHTVIRWGPGSIFETMSRCVFWKESQQK